MDGILVIDKPAGITSHDVVNRVRQILGIRRVGHTGTLDPFATGVMVVLVGKATRLARFLDKDEKEYEALMRIGFETDTGDRTGTKIEEEGIPHPFMTDMRALLVAMMGFFDEIEQIPPMFSAKKVDGQKLYERARRGEIVDRKPVKVEIYEMMLFENNGKWPWPPHDLIVGTKDVGLQVVCSAGTYIRTLAEDIARAAGTRAHLAELNRTRSGRFTKEMAISLEELDAMPHPGSALLPLEEAVSHLPAFELPPERVSPTRNGLSTRVKETDQLIPDTDYRMISPKRDLIAIGTFDPHENAIRPKMVLSGDNNS